VLRSGRRAEDAGCLVQAILSQGRQAAVEAALVRVGPACAALEAILEQVPEEWRQEAGLDLGQLHTELERRATRLRDIVNPESWGDATTLDGGSLLLGGQS